jgi:hypothetical protein
MSDSLQKAIDEMQVKLQAKLNEASELKKAINTLCSVMGTPAMYADVEAESASGAIGPTRPDIYYGKPLATAVKEYLEYRKQAVKPEDILSALVQGGFDFDAIEWNEKGRLRNLAISLSKNTTTFRKLPNGMIGLESWYEGSVPLKRKTRKRTGDEAEDGEQKETGSTADTAEPDKLKATA